MVTISHTRSSAWRCVFTNALAPACSNPPTRRCLCHELKRSGIAHECQVPLPVDYDGIKLECGYRADIIVCGKVILEIKSVERVVPLHEAQLLTYLRLSTCRVGLLINFNTVSLTDGLRRRVL
jgi:GxxExxY protein